VVALVVMEEAAAPWNGSITSNSTRVGTTIRTVERIRVLQQQQGGLLLRHRMEVAAVAVHAISMRLPQPITGTTNHPLRRYVPVVLLRWDLGLRHHRTKLRQPTGKSDRGLLPSTQWAIIIGVRVRVILPIAPIVEEVKCTIITPSIIITLRMDHHLRNTIIIEEQHLVERHREREPSHRHHLRIISITTVAAAAAVPTCWNNTVRPCDEVEAVIMVLVLV